MSELKGLSSVEATQRLQTYGKNMFIEAEKQSAFSTFLDEFKSPLVIMLFAAAIISAVFDSYISATIIVSIIVVSSTIDFFVSYKSQQAADALAAQITPRTTVVRDGKEIEIALEDVVPGDIVVLEAGNIVPADGVVVDGHDLFTNESSLTGESGPVEKKISSEVYLGSGVVTGRAYIEVKQTGYKTKFASIVQLLSQKENASEFEKGISEFSFFITRIVVVMAVVVFIINATLKHSILESLIFSLALAVGITPELLPMIIAINVSNASIKMSKNGVIVKKLSAIENFGSMNVLCTDKTGTLTEDKISVVRYVDADGKDSDELLKLAYIDSVMHTGTKSPLDEAIAEFKNFDISQYKKVDELPFDFERRRNSIVFEKDNNVVLVSKGAPEFIFNVTTIGDAEKEKANALFSEFSAQGYRVLAVATKTFTNHGPTYATGDESGLEFKGFIAFIDPPKEGVKEVLAELSRINVEVKVVTGDHRLVAEKIAQEVGLINKGTLEADEIDALSDEELIALAPQKTLFVRVTPAQKNRIIIALQKNGQTVGYMGDGINDAPALRTADVGISVNNAVDVAKDAADIILLTKSLDQLVRGVKEGRRTFANTVKYIAMTVSSNFGNMFSMTGASLFLPFLPMLPTQILLNNLLYDASQFTLTFDQVDEDILSRPNPWNIRFIKKFMIVFGTLSSVFDFITFYILYKLFFLSGSAFQTGWFIESFASQTLVIFFIRTHLPFLASKRAHSAVIISTWIAVITAWSIALLPIGFIFGFTPLNISLVSIIAVIVIIYFVMVEIVKRWFYRKYNDVVAL